MKYYTAAAALVGTVSAAIPCVPLSESTAWEPNPNTLDGFHEAHNYNDNAHNVATPAGYERVLLNSNATISSTKYMRHSEIPSYNAETCVELCSTTRGCKAFNLYYLRSPSLVPDAACPNPKANVLTLCTLYAGPVEAAWATNYGQVSGPLDASGEAFTIAIRGSNAYNKLPESPAKETVTVTIPCFGVDMPALMTATVTETKIVALAATDEPHPRHQIWF